MGLIDNILNKDITNLTYKERQSIIDYFRKLVNDEFDKFKDRFLQKTKKEIFERVYLIDTYDNIRIRLCGLGFFSILSLLKYQKDNFIDYVYNADVNDNVFDYYYNIEKEIKNEVTKIRNQNGTECKEKVA